MIWTILSFFCLSLSADQTYSTAHHYYNTPIDSIPYRIYYQYDHLEEDLFKTQDDEILVLNFWATWCAPCIKELPYFEALNEESDQNNMRVILISLDFKNQIKNKFIPFIEKHHLKSELAILLDGKANSWIPRVSEEWSGAIPATLFIKGKHKIFVEASFESLEEIKSYINQLN